MKQWSLNLLLLFLFRFFPTEISYALTNRSKKAE
jgi:hypothetical protein